MGYRYSKDTRYPPPVCFCHTRDASISETEQDKLLKLWLLLNAMEPDLLIRYLPS